MKLARTLSRKKLVGEILRKIIQLFDSFTTKHVTNCTAL